MMQVCWGIVREVPSVCGMGVRGFVGAAVRADRI